MGVGGSGTTLQSRCKSDIVNPSTCKTRFAICELAMLEEDWAKGLACDTLIHLTNACLKKITRIVTR